jgi:hypothetical protein
MPAGKNRTARARELPGRKINELKQNEAALLRYHPQLQNLAQECLWNIAKHSGVAKVRVALPSRNP